MDEVRISKGIARYTEPFPVPTQEFFVANMQIGYSGTPDAFIQQIGIPIYTGTVDFSEHLGTESKEGKGIFRTAKTVQLTRSGTLTAGVGNIRWRHARN